MDIDTVFEQNAAVTQSMRAAILKDVSVQQAAPMTVLQASQLQFLHGLTTDRRWGPRRNEASYWNAMQRMIQDHHSAGTISSRAYLLSDLLLMKHRSATVRQTIRFHSLAPDESIAFTTRVNKHHAQFSAKAHELTILHMMHTVMEHDHRQTLLALVPPAVATIEQSKSARMMHTVTHLAPAISMYATACLGIAADQFTMGDQPLAWQLPVLPTRFATVFAQHVDTLHDMVRIQHEACEPSMQHDGWTV